MAQEVRPVQKEIKEVKPLSIAKSIGMSTDKPVFVIRPAGKRR